MNRIELQKQLNDGIQAVRAGDRARARELLLGVVQADETNEPAWLWLSAALEEPAERLQALENVLLLNPRQPQALAGAEKLRLSLGLPVPADPEPLRPPIVPELYIHPGTPDTTTNKPAHTVVFAVQADPSIADEDPYQCAYCGRPAAPEAARCPHCGRGLLAAGPWYGGTYLYGTLILAGLLFQSSMVEALAVYLAATFPNTLSFVPFVGLLTTNVLWPAIARVLLWMLVLFALLDEASFSFRLAAVVAAADLAWLGVGYRLGLLSPLIAGLNAGLAAPFGILAISAVISRLQAQVRLKVVPARKMSSAMEFNREAQANARQGRWALAALHWQRAITQSPREPKYYKALGQAQARLGRYEQAAKNFQYGIELDPADRDLRRLLASLPKQS